MNRSWEWYAFEAARLAAVVLFVYAVAQLTGFVQ